MNISTWEITDFDSAVEKQINNWVKLDNWGMGLIDDDGNIVTKDVIDIDESLNEHQGQVATQATLLGVIQNHQHQINKLNDAMAEIFKRNRDLEKDLNRVTWALRKSADALNDIKIGDKYVTKRPKTKDFACASCLPRSFG